jgi:hypothetical protein
MRLTLRAPQWKVFRCRKRFRVLVAGRRFGKTQLALVELCQAAWERGRLAWYVGPTYKQAKRVAWNRLKQMTRPYWANRPRETDLSIELAGGGTIALRGADNYDGLRGDGLDFLVADEYATMAREAWTEVLRPALADRMGQALFIGTPQGHNHFYDLYEAASDREDWARFQFTTAEGGNVSRQELQSAARELDERTYRQEFEASFENLTSGRLYYSFEREANVQTLRYQPSQPIFWALDFNMNPMCSLIGQKIGEQVHVLQEIILPDSHTWAACEEFLQRTAAWSVSRQLTVYVYGDASGESRKTSASRTDWQIVREALGRYPERFRTVFRVPGANPTIKDRVNCMNARLRNHVGEVRLLVDGSCKELIQDLERVRWKEDAHGNALAEMDRSDWRRTHASDALGYMIAKEFAMRPTFGEKAGPAIF